MANALTNLFYQDSSEISVLKELATFEETLNGSANLYFGEIDHDKMITAYLEDNRDYLDTLYKRHCALSAYHFKISKNRASIGDFFGAIKALGEAKTYRLAAMENYCGEGDLAEQDTNRQKSNARHPRIDPLQCLIIDIVIKNPDINAKTLPDELEKYKGHGVIEDVTDDEISFVNKERLDIAPISGLKDRLGRAKKKLNRTNRLARKHP